MGLQKRKTYYAAFCASLALLAGSVINAGLSFIRPLKDTT